MNKTETVKLETELNKRFGSQLKQDFSLKQLTTLNIGGPAEYLIVAESEDDLVSAIKLVQKYKLNWYVVGEGSNIVPADKGFNGLIIKNRIKNFEQNKLTVRLGAGNNLLETINELNRLGLAGLEKMAGIPGSIGGAVYGSAGAYGQEIKDRVVRVRVYDAKKGRFKSLSKKDCRLGYRDSIFKQYKTWIMTEVILRMKTGKPNKLNNVSAEIIKLREKKYKPGLKCPGSFFKNIKLDELKPRSEMEKLVRKIDPDKVMFGKVPAGYLLEEVGAKGMKQGRVRVAGHHGNLIYNSGGAKAADIVRLAKKLKQLVKKKFGVKLEEEIRYLGFN